MRRTILISICAIAWTLAASGQSTYFNLLNGVDDDLESEGITNVESLGDDFMTWGGGVDSLGPFYLIRAYDEFGIVENENTVRFSPEVVYPGVTNSFLRIPEQDLYLMTQGSYGSPAGSIGFAMMVDGNLDTLWTRRYDLFDSQTYFFTHHYTDDGFLLAGLFDQAPGASGSFIAKMDWDGDILWQQVVHEPWEGEYRMTGISEFGSQIITSGSRGLVDEAVGILDILDLDGNILWSASNDPNDGEIRHHLVNGKAYTFESDKYEDFEPLNNPTYGYTTLDIKEIDLENQELLQRANFFTENEWVSSAVNKVVGTAEGGMVVCGSFNKPVANDEIDLMGFILQLNSNFDLEWYTELRYDDGSCTTCASELWDMEPTSDGGYVAVGKFIDYAIDPRQRSWLIKVDACGDLVYNGCGPVGLVDYGAFPNDSGLSRLRLYPNPTTDYIQLDMEGIVAVKTIVIRDMTGKGVLVEPWRGEGQLIHIEHLDDGLYVLETVLVDGSRGESRTFEVIR